MESHLPAFKEKNPQLELVTELIRGQHPHLKGLYSKIFYCPTTMDSCTDFHMILKEAFESFSP